MKRLRAIVAALALLVCAAPSCDSAAPSPTTTIVVDVTRDARWLWEGDSLSDAAYPYQMLAPLWAAQAEAYGDGGPTVVNSAVNGSPISAIDARIGNELMIGSYTHVALCMGTNERAGSRETTRAALTSLAAKFTTQRVLLVGPYAWGERVPSGTNVITGANDQRLDETDEDIPAIFLSIYPNAVYVSLRQLMYAALAAPGQDVGPNTVDGAHWSQKGRDAANVFIRNVVSFNR